MSVIPSVPSSFSTPGGSGFASVTFALPSGTFLGASFEIQGTHALGVTMIAKIGADSLTMGSVTLSTPYDFTASATPAQLADINAAAGGSLTVAVGSGGNASAVSLFTLTLTQASSGNRQSSDHELDASFLYVPGVGIHLL